MRKTNLMFVIGATPILLTLATLNIANAQPHCLSGPELVETSPWMTYRWENKCGGSITIRWTMVRIDGDSKGKTEKGSWTASRCSTLTKQYFRGDYTFSYEFVNTRLEQHV